jgi:hypothetical protein
MHDGSSADVTPPEQAIERDRADLARSLRPTVDEMSEWSFPASDPPATWTWDPIPDEDDG